MTWSMSRRATLLPIWQVQLTWLLYGCGLVLVGLLHTAVFASGISITLISVTSDGTQGNHLSGIPSFG